MRPSLRGTAIAAAAAGTASAAAYAAQRVAAARIRSNDDEDADRTLEEPLYATHKLDSHDAGSLHAIEAGDPDAPTIVLSHGVTLSVRTWFYQLENLPREGFRVIAFDHRGHGASVLGETGHSVANLAEDMRSVVVGLDLRDAVIVGHSMGGIALQAFATQFPDVARERLRGIVLLSTMARAPLAAGAQRFDGPLDQIVRWLPDTTRLWRSRNLGFVLSRIAFGRDPKPSHVELVRRMMLSCSEETRVLASRALVSLDLSDAIKHIQLPTLVIGGTADVLTPPAEARRIARLIPNARLELVPGGGHMLMLERTELVDRLIVDFARDVQATPRRAASSG